MSLVAPTNLFNNFPSRLAIQINPNLLSYGHDGNGICAEAHELYVGGVGKHSDRGFLANDGGRNISHGNERGHFAPKVIHK